MQGVEPYQHRSVDLCMKVEKVLSLTTQIPNTPYGKNTPSARPLGIYRSQAFQKEICAWVLKEKWFNNNRQ